MNILELRQEIVKKEYLHLLTQLAIYNFDKKNELSLMQSAYDLINNWRILMSKIFSDCNEFTYDVNGNNDKLTYVTTFNNKSYNDKVKKVFNSDYNQIITEMKIFTYYTYMENNNNIIAKALSYAFEKEYQDIDNIDILVNELYNNIINSENKEKKLL